MRTHSHGSRGFTLIEVTLAVGIIAIALVSLVGMIPASHGIMQESGARAQWHRLQGTLRERLNGSGYAVASASLDNGRALYLYRYLGNRAVRADGSWIPEPQGNLLLPTSAARWEDDPLLAADLRALSGPLFRVKLERFPASQASPVPIAAAPATAISVWAVAEQVPSAIIGGRGKLMARKAVFLQP